MTATEQGRIFYVDDCAGNDSFSGLSEKEAWLSLERVNAEVFRPGDTIRLKKGGEWHGMLAPKGSGAPYAPVILESFGEGAMPAIHGDGKLLDRPRHPGNQSGAGESCKAGNLHLCQPPWHHQGHCSRGLRNHRRHRGKPEKQGRLSEHVLEFWNLCHHTGTFL